MHIGAGAHYLIVPGANRFIIRGLSPLMFHLFSENVLFMCSTNISAVLQLLFKCLYSAVNPTVAEHDARTMSSIPKNIYLLVE